MRVWLRWCLLALAIVISVAPLVLAFTVQNAQDLEPALVFLGIVSTFSFFVTGPLAFVVSNQFERTDRGVLN